MKIETQTKAVSFVYRFGELLKTLIMLFALLYLLKACCSRFLLFDVVAYAFTLLLVTSDWYRINDV